MTMLSIAELSATPQLSIKTVCARTGIRAVTLRAWERRYKLLTPHRTNGNYRLYSEQDVAVLRWLKARVDSGQPISLVAAEFKAMRRARKWPDPPLLLELPQGSPTQVAAYPPAIYAQRLYAALVLQHDEAAATALLNEVQVSFDMQVVCENIMAPCLVEIGEAWHRGEIRIATEHFASYYLRGRLLMWYQSYPIQRSAPRLVVGGAPGELHDIGCLMLALFLRRLGYWVEFLGADVHLEDLIEYVRTERPAFVGLAAGTEEGARKLQRLQSALARLRPAPRFGFGGRAFNLKPALRQAVPGLFLGETLSQATQTIRDLLPV
jgi:DNA-binding transcriptional MerR regulator